MLQRHLIFSEILSLPTLFALLLLILAWWIKRRTPARKLADAQPLPQIGQPAIPIAGRRGKLARFVLFSLYAAVFVYWSGTVGFDVTPTVVMMTALTLAVSFLLHLFYFKSPTRWLSRFGGLAMFVVLVISSIFLVPTVLWGLSNTIAFFFLYLTLLLATDYSARHLVRLAKIDLPPGTLLPILFFLFWVLLRYGPSRNWHLPPATVLEICPQIATGSITITAIAFFAALFLAKVNKRKKLLPALPAIWLYLLLSTVFAVYLSTAAYRFDIAPCNGIQNDPNLAHFTGTYLTSDSAFDDKYFYIAEKEPRRLKKFDKRGRLTAELKLNLPPNEIVLDRKSGLLYVLAVDIDQAPITVVDTGQFKVVRLINLGDEGWPIRLFFNEQDSEMTVITVSNKENLFLINTLTAEIIARDEVAELHDRRMTGIYDDFTDTIWLSDYIGRGLTRIGWKENGTVSLIATPFADSTFYLTHSLLPISPETMLIARLLDPFHFKIGIIESYNTTRWKKQSEIDLRIVRYFVYNRQLGVVFAVSLADDSLHSIDMDTGITKQEAYLGPQPRNLHLGDNGEVILCSKCGAFLYLPQTQTFKFGGWDDGQLSDFARFSLDSAFR